MVAFTADLSRHYSSQVSGVTQDYALGTEFQKHKYFLNGSFLKDFLDLIFFIAFVKSCLRTVFEGLLKQPNRHAKVCTIKE